MEHAADRPVLSLADLESFDPSAPERGRERRFCCPLPGCADKRRDARHRSLSVNVETGRWHCHRCDAGGLLREKWSVREPRYNAKRASSRRAFALTQQAGGVSFKTTAQPATRAHSTHQDRWRELFLQAPHVSVDVGVAYLASRGIPREIAATADVRYVARWPHWSRTARADWILNGTSRRIVFPIRDRAGKLVAVQGRVIGPNECGPKIVTRGDLGAGLFQSEPDALSSPLLVLVEAPIDALSLAVAGVPALAVCGTNVPEWLPPAVPFRRIALGFDADAAGDKASAKAAIEFRAFGCTVERLRPARKDWNEVLLDAGVTALKEDLKEIAAECSATRD